MRAIILSIGDELVLGQTVDTNSAWISQQLATVGCAVVAHTTVGDDQRAIEQAIGESVGRCDALIISGGIGPTDDDLTRQALAAVMGVELEVNPEWLAHLEAFFRKINRPMSALNRIQAMIPRGATMIFNTAGTAAGIDATLRPDKLIYNDPGGVIRMEHSGSGPLRVFVMPGVPKEMKVMFARDVLPHIAERSGGAVILSRTLHTFGLGESAIAEKLGALMDRKRNPSVGTTVAGGIVSLRVNARFDAKDKAARQLEETERACRAALGELIFGRDDETLQAVIAKLLLARNGETVTTAESCTGGIVAKMLTDTPGSSAYFRQGWVTYANEAKASLLGVPEALLQAHGAVSEPVVRAMAEGARSRAKATYALAVSGIAGPDGGTPTKPVGTVWFGLARSDATDARMFVMTGDREMIRDRSAKMALTMLRFHLLGQALPF